MSESWSPSRHGRIAVLNFTRPPRSSMDVRSMGELVGHLERLAEAVADVSVVRLTGGIDGTFIAHADLDDLARIARGEDVGGDLGAWSRALALLEEIPQPTVAAIDGQAWGGGCETALACTLRIGSERAHLGQPEVSVGIIPGAGGTQRLPRLVGPSIGAEPCLSGRVIDAAEGHRIGLLNAVLPTDGFLDAALARCERMARHPAPALFAAKRAVIRGLRGSLAEGLALEGRLFAGLNSSDEARARNAAVPRPTDG